MNSISFKKLFAYSIGLWLLTLSGWGYFYVRGRERAPSDRRYVVALNQSERKIVFVQMASLTQGVSDTLSALADNDTSRLTEIAGSLGAKRGQSQLPDTLMVKFPREYNQLMTLTRGGFDALANMAEHGASKDMLLKRFARLTNLCVTCHGGYTIKEVRQGGF